MITSDAPLVGVGVPWMVVPGLDNDADPTDCAIYADNKNLVRLGRKGRFIASIGCANRTNSNTINFKSYRLRR